MKTRLCCLSEEHFNTCVAHKLWGANSTHPKKWDIGDILIFKVDNKLAGVARVIGEAYIDDTKIWDNGLFFYRVELDFERVLTPENRIAFDGEIKDSFISLWGKSYGWVILNKYPLPLSIRDLILSKFKMNA
ncbi:EVE domain-containing protein [Geomonas sp. RF6]|uniref:EVE domain-containing protein n=1 Tax=Geomonas sp. RF6 TaxID=2897342 RepID=UPI001E58FC35|nr:EVE domain-containing protein [Geomonas sp. RF6]UFS71765.1 EVE domain-containing protein [Geomonas sp. RF6]